MQSTHEARDAGDGLFRATVAGPNARLTEVFDHLYERVRAGADGTAQARGFGLYGATVAVPGEAEEGRWELINVRDEIFIVISDCNYSFSRTEHVLPEGFVEFHFTISGPASVDFSDAGQVQVDAPNVMVCHQGKDMRYKVTCGPGPWRAVAIYVTRAHFERFLTAAGGPGDLICRELASVGDDQVYWRQMAVNVDLLNVIEQFLEIPYTGARRLMFAQAKAQEALCACIDLWQGALVEQPTANVLSARDLRLIEKARDLIVADLQRAPTIPELARAVGTNTSKLKRGFKFLYGMTLFEFGQRCRMNTALRLLVHERMPVGQVAASVGYQHQTSFTASFRQYFGFAPKDARRLASPGPQPERGDTSAATRPSSR